GRRCPQAKSAEYPAPALALRAPWLRGPLRWAARQTLAQARPGGRGGAHPAPVPGALSRLQRAALLPARPAGAWRHTRLFLRETPPPAGRPAPDAAPAGPPSPAAGAPAVLRRVAAPRWQSACLAGSGPGPPADLAGGG